MPIIAGVKSRNEVTWLLGSLSALLTIAVTVITTITAKDIQYKNLKLQENQKEIDRINLNLHQFEIKSSVESRKYSDDYRRYEFVNELLPKLLSQKNDEKTLIINLLKIVLPEVEYNKLFLGLEISTNPNVAAAGKLGMEQIQASQINRDQTIAKLAKDLNNSQKDLRLAAANQLVQEYSSRYETILNVLELLDSTNISSLSASGRINALYVLTQTNRNIWNAELKDDANNAIRRIESRVNSGIEIGPQTEQYINNLKEFLKTI